VEWSDEEEQWESEVGSMEESSGSEVDADDPLAGLSHLVKGCGRDPFVGSMVETMAWAGLLALSRKVK
jgi:hypothetical protein